MVNHASLTLKEFAEDCDFHGVKYIARNDHGTIRRVFWAVLFLISVGVLIYNTVDQVTRYLKYEHTSQYDIEYVSSIEFPAITICNVNKHRRTALTADDIAVMGPHLGFTDSNLSLIHPELYPEDWYQETFVDQNLTAVQLENRDKSFDLEDFYNRTGHQMNDLIQHCKWKTKLCNESSWTTQFTHYGKCYTFNSDASHKLLKAGAGNGLYLVLNVEETEYMESTDSDDLGIKFLAHDTSSPPFLKELGYGMAPGYHHMMALRQRKITELGLPYVNCTADHPSTYFPNYTVAGCRIECETEAIFNECGCKLVESPGDHPICTIEQFDCAEQMLARIEGSDECLCENPCKATEYSFVSSSLRLRSSTIEKLKKVHPISPNLTKNDLVVVNIYFDTLSAESLTQAADYTFISVLSDFGGTLGLWLGASVLAALQILDYFVVKILNKCYYKKGIQPPDSNNMKMQA